MLDYKPQAMLVTSNFGGISIMIDPENEDYLYYKCYEDEPIRVEIKYAQSDDEDSFPMFRTEEGFPYRVDEFMRTNY